MRRADILARVDELLADGAIATTSGPYPVLQPGDGERGRCGLAVPFRVGVLVSGEGTNLQALLDSVHGRDGIEIVGVGASRADARGLERARAAGVDTGVFDKVDHPDRDARDAAMGNWLDDHASRPAGAGRVHGDPRRSLHPAFRGSDQSTCIPRCCRPSPGVGAIDQALDYGVRLIGVTVHFVDEGVDSGPVLLQEAFELPYARDIAAIEAQVHAVEHRLLPRAVRLIASGAVSRDPDHPRLVRVDERGA
ncbi:MAG: formyltransferase family protein [Thermoleophilaceae bacterium]